MRRAWRRPWPRWWRFPAELGAGRQPGECREGPHPRGLRVDVEPPGDLGPGQLVDDRPHREGEQGPERGLDDAQPGQGRGLAFGQLGCAPAAAMPVETDRSQILGAQAVGNRALVELAQADASSPLREADHTAGQELVETVAPAPGRTELAAVDTRRLDRMML